MFDRYSFIDNANKDFLRDKNGGVLIVPCKNYHAAEEWLLKNGEDHGWSKTGIEFFNWSEEFGESLPKDPLGEHMIGISESDIDDMFPLEDLEMIKVDTLKVRARNHNKQQSDKRKGAKALLAKLYSRGWFLFRQ